MKKKYSEIVSRFAPSPTGDPHIGNIRTALFTYLFIKSQHGKFILRIEDTDKAREVPGSIDRIKDGLQWLGISYDEGPILQSSRLALYKKAALDLVQHGHAYYCFCTPQRLEELRRKQEKDHLPPMYDRHCRTLSRDEALQRTQTEPYVVRLKVPDTGETAFTDYLRGTITVQNKTIDDQVLLKSDGYPTYHLAVVVDDHDMGITHVMRGEDWISSTPKHVLLYQFFGWEMPTFVHLSLIIGKDKKKLSKRLGDLSLLSYKEQGYQPLAVLNFLSRLGYSPKDDRKLYSLDELAQEFSLDRLHKNPAIFDLDKLNWFNRLAKETGETEGNLIEPITETLQSHHVVQNPLTDVEYHFVKEAAKRITTTNEVAATLSYLWQRPEKVHLDELVNAHSETSVKNVFTDIEAAAEKITDWDENTVGTLLREQQRMLSDWPSRDFYQLLTLVISGSTSAPPLFASIALLGKEEFLKRLENAL